MPANSDTISRAYAIAQIDLAIAESNDKLEVEQFERFKCFLLVLPAIETKQ